MPFHLCVFWDCFLMAIVKWEIVWTADIHHLDLALTLRKKLVIYNLDSSISFLFSFFLLLTSLTSGLTGQVLYRLSCILDLSVCFSCPLICFLLLLHPINQKLTLEDRSRQIIQIQFLTNVVNVPAHSRLYLIIPDMLIFICSFRWW
jgi:hypothetical protein